MSCEDEEGRPAESAAVAAVLDWREGNEPIHRLAEPFGGYWGEHPGYPISDWRHEVANDDTREGYWEWVAAAIEEGRA